MKKGLLFAIVMVIMAAMVMSCASGGGSSDSGAAAAAGGAPIKLKAFKAKLVSGGGEGIRMEDGGNVGYWGHLDDKVQWTADIPEEGDYVVSVQYSVAESFANATVNVTVGDTVLEWKVLSTSTWSNYKNVDLGEVHLAAGSVPVEMQATAIANRFIANVKYLLLTKK